MEKGDNLLIPTPNLPTAGVRSPPPRSAGCTQGVRTLPGGEHRATCQRENRGHSHASVSQSTRRPCSCNAPDPGALHVWHLAQNSQGGEVQCEECSRKTSSGSDSSCAGSRRLGGRGPGRNWRSGARPPCHSPLQAGSLAELSSGARLPGQGGECHLRRESSAAANPRREAEEERRGVS